MVGKTAIENAKYCPQKLYRATYYQFLIFIHNNCCWDRCYQLKANARTSSCNTNALTFVDHSVYKSVLSSQEKKHHNNRMMKESKRKGLITCRSVLSCSILYLIWLTSSLNMSLS